jgi:hypothetical protein
MAASIQPSSSPLAAIEAGLLSFAVRAHASPKFSCIGVIAFCESGGATREIAAIGETAGATLLNVFESLAQKAKDKGEMSPDVNPKEAALFLDATCIALKVVAHGGAKPTNFARSGGLPAEL